MTVFEFHLAAARTVIISLGFVERFREMCFSFSHDGHHIGCRPTGAHQHGEDFQGFADPVEEALVPGTQVIQTRLTIRGFNKAILGALTMAGKAHITIQAVSG